MRFCNNGNCPPKTTIFGFWGILYAEMDWSKPGFFLLRTNCSKILWSFSRELNGDDIFILVFAIFIKICEFSLGFNKK